MAHIPSPGDDVRFVGGLAYAAPLGFRPLLLDLYLPRRAGSGSAGRVHARRRLAAR